MDEIEKEGTKGIELLTKLVQLTQKTKKELADNPDSFIYKNSFRDVHIIL